MRVAIIGSRTLDVRNLERYLPPETTQIISGSAKGIDTCARMYARGRGIPFIEFLPDYARHGRFAPLRRNANIVAHSDLVLAFWNGESRGTRWTIELCRARGVPVRVFVWKAGIGRYLRK